MREADAQKVYRSYTTEWNQGKKRWEVKQETWIVGHTPAHKATPEEALKYRAEKLFDDVVQLNKQRAQISVDLARITYQEKN